MLIFGLARVRGPRARRTIGDGAGTRRALDAEHDESADYGPGERGDDVSRGFAPRQRSPSAMSAIVAWVSEGAATER